MTLCRSLPAASSAAVPGGGIRVRHLGRRWITLRRQSRAQALEDGERRTGPFMFRESDHVVGEVAQERGHGVRHPVGVDGAAEGRPGLQADEWRGLAAHLEQYAAEAEDVGTAGEGRISVVLFGSRVSVSPGSIVPGATHAQGESDVDQPRRARSVEHDVLRLEVTMDKTLGMDDVENLAQLADDGGRDVFLERTIIPNEIRKRRAFDVLHGEVRAAGVHASVEDAWDSIDPGQRHPGAGLVVNFPRVARVRLRSFERSRMLELHGHCARVAQVPGFDHLSLPTIACTALKSKAIIENDGRGMPHDGMA